ncbi:MAG: GtrA family protein [Pseudomonadota bacterium]
MASTIAQENNNVKPLLTKFLQFSGVGIIGTSAHYAILIFLVDVLAISAVKASSAGFIAGALTNYMLNYRYTFASKKRHQEAMIKFFIVALIGLFFNGLIMSGCTQFLQLHYLVSQVMATVLVLLWNFTANHKWTFHEPVRSTDDALGK